MAQVDKYLSLITKYNEASIFEDSKYKDMTWQQFYKLEEANELVDAKNYDFDLMNAAMFFSVNKYRSTKSIRPLVYEPRLRDAAAIHSYEMVRNNFFDHINRYDKVVAMPNVRIEMCGYQGERIAENIARSFIDLEKPISYTQLADKVVRELSTSYDHNRHMIDPDLDKLGCGLIFEKQPKDGYLYYRLSQEFGRDWR
jgi:hypothetical protein